MSHLIDLAAWSVAFVVLFFLFRWLQARKRNNPSDTPEE